MARARLTGQKDKALPPKKTTARKAPAANAPARPKASPAPTLAERAALVRRSWSQVIENRGFLPLETLEADLVLLAAPATAAKKPTWELLTSGLWLQGAEVCLRVARAGDERTPPPWSLSALKAIASSIKATTRALSEGESLVPAGPLAEGIETDLRGVVFTKDQSFQELQTKFDTVVVLLAVGITADEAKLLREWSPHAFLEVYAKADPTLTTDPERASLLSSPRARTIIEQRVDREGSSLQAISAASSSIVSDGANTVWSLSVDGVEALVSLLKGRLAHQRPFTLQGPSDGVLVVPADEPSYAVLDGTPTLKLSQTAARALRAQLRPKKGRVAFDLIPRFTIEVV
jgi:hypothetical protein